MKNCKKKTPKLPQKNKEWSETYKKNWEPVIFHDVYILHKMVVNWFFPHVCVMVEESQKIQKSIILPCSRMSCRVSFYQRWAVALWLHLLQCDLQAPSYSRWFDIYIYLSFSMYVCILLLGLIVIIFSFPLNCYCVNWIK